MSSSSAPAGSDTVRVNDPYENSASPFDSVVRVRRALIVSRPSWTVTSMSSIGSTPEQLGAYLVDSLLGLSFQSHQVIVEERAKTGERGQAVDELQSSGSKGRD